MKPGIAFLLPCLIASGMLFSCEESESPDKEPKKVELHKKAAEIIQADNEFGFELFREVVAKSEGDNILISPLSVSYALGMTYNGAAGSTLDAFNEVLHLNDLSKVEVNESYKDLMDQILTLDDNVEFSLANSIWYREGFEVLEEFITLNREYFNAEVTEIDFTDPLTVETINQWIEERTNGKIKDMLDIIPEDAVMYLINALYFNAKWKYEFEKSETYQGEFHLSGFEQKQVDFMRIEGSFGYASNEYFTSVELPYGDSAYSMVVCLPAAQGNISELVSHLSIVNWESWFEDALQRGVRIDLPKFKFGFKALLNDPLKNLGLSVAFKMGEADFSNINPAGNLYINRVIHQCFIDVQEEGTEAAAATIVEVNKYSSGGEGTPIIFKVDRPFLFLIKENSTGAFIFMGKVGNPLYS
jgi:serine protease inhibitor